MCICTENKVHYANMCSILPKCDRLIKKARKENVIYPHDFTLDFHRNRSTEDF